MRALLQSRSFLLSMFYWFLSNEFNCVSSPVTIYSTKFQGEKNTPSALVGHPWQKRLRKVYTSSSIIFLIQQLRDFWWQLVCVVEVNMGSKSELPKERERNAQVISRPPMMPTNLATHVSFIFYTIDVWFYHNAKWLLGVGEWVGGERPRRAKYNK